MSCRELLRLPWTGCSNRSLLPRVNMDKMNRHFMADCGRHYILFVSQFYFYNYTSLWTLSALLPFSSITAHKTHSPLSLSFLPSSYLCRRGSVSAEPEEGPAGRRCSPGFYCPQGTAYMVPCQTGTLSSTEGDNKLLRCPWYLRETNYLG